MDALGAFVRAEDVQLDRSLYTMIELEGRRYGGFFAKLDARGEGAIPRAAAVGFFAKSSLSDAQVTELYERVKSVGLLPDPERMNAAEFTMAMHLIVCMTKRSLAKIPPVFPTYLFPTLDLTPASAKPADEDVWSVATAPSPASTSAFSAFPSPSPSPSAPSSLLPDVAAGFAAMKMNGSNGSYHDTPKLRMEDLSTSSSSLSAALSASKLTEARSLTEFVHAEVRHRKAEEAGLVRLEHSEMRTLQRLHSCLDQIASQVDSLGFPVPSASRTLDALDDLNNLFAKHVHAVKQEIQSMEISAQMMDVASERTESMPGMQRKTDPLRQVAALTDELVRLQQEVQALATRRDTLSAQAEAAETASRSSSASIPAVTSSMPVFAGSVSTPTPTPTPSLDAYSTLAMSGGSSSTDVFSVASSVTNVASEVKTDDPWASVTPLIPPASSETPAKPDSATGMSASMPSPPTSSAFGDDWGAFSAPPAPQESVLAAPEPTTTGTDDHTTKPAVNATFADDWGDFGAATSQPESVFASPASADKDKSTTTSVTAPAFGDEWSSFGATTSQPGTASVTPEPASIEAKPLSSHIPPVTTSSALTDEWGTFGSAPSQEQHGSTNGSANGSASADPFGFGSPVAAIPSAPSAATATATGGTGNSGQTAAAAKDEFGWGDFQ